MFKFIRHWVLQRRFGALEVIEYAHEYKYRLKELWRERESPEPPPSEQKPEPSNAETDLADIGARFSRPRSAPLEWKIAFTGNFTKAISAVDRSMQGRILVAITDISSGPTTLRGDTVKPLSSDKKGQWRYRLGDYRLVYESLPEERMVVLIDFAARGGVYE